MSFGNFNDPQQSQNQSTNWYQRCNPSPRSVAQNYLPGRLVFSPDQITPQEIPTNGTPAIFPLDDGSAIYVKVFQPDGTFGEYKYVLEKPQPVMNTAPSEPSNIQPTMDQNAEKTANYDKLVERVDFLEQVINELLKRPKNADQNEANKEVEKNG